MLQMKFITARKNAMWKVIKKCLPRTETSKPVYSKDKKLLADEFNDFFTSVGAQVAETSKRPAIEHNLSPIKPTIEIAVDSSG